MARHAGALADAGAEVAVDFTVVDAARDNIAWCADNGVHAVVGTTGFSSADIDDFRTRFEASSANAVIAPNFAIGAVLMVRFAELAAPWFETAEVIELHHDQKIDAPSGTAHRTRSSAWPRRRPTGRPTPPPRRSSRARAGEWAPAGIHVHSVRLRGLVAHEEVLLGTGRAVALDPSRLLRPHVVHARCGARGEGGARPAGPHRRARPAAGSLTWPVTAA